MTSSEKVEKFKKIINELEIDIKDDDKWPLVFEQIIRSGDLNQQYKDWKALLEFFHKQEGKLGHCHKGQIFWKLGVMDLINGSISSAIAYLDLSSEEDKIKLNGEKRITASIGLLSVIKPLLHRYKNKSQSWELDKNLNALYELLSDEEKRKFATILLEAHDNFSTGKTKIILENFFTFITNDRIREITKDMYKEVSESILLGAQTTYISQIFAIGSMCEAILDELFQRNDQEVWKIFRLNDAIQQQIAKEGRNSKMKQQDYDSSMNLGEKIWMLRAMVGQRNCPITKESVLLLSIIGEYRDLIHPRRRLSFPFDPNRYVASVLIACLSHIAGDWWPENVRKIIEANYQLNK
jgi:hypothetical protein